MSEFIDYGKRDPLLPEGCKDLTDLWEPKRALPDEDSAFKIAGEMRKYFENAVHRRNSGTIKICAIEPLIQNVFDFQGVMAGVHLRLPDESLSLSFSKHHFDQLTKHFAKITPIPPGTRATWLSGDVTFREDETRAALMNQFFASHQLKVPTFGPNPPSFVPGAPVSLIYRIDPFRMNAQQASEFCRDMFAKICGLNGDSELQFDSHEMELRPEKK
jgi:hypothetical protein